ncbi:MAG: hypothetical protein AAFR89_10700, partial [Cyanobacteria bacterium J06633_1]
MGRIAYCFSGGFQELPVKKDRPNSLIAGILIWITIQVGLQAIPAIKEFGLSFFTGSSWNPPEKQY